MKFYGNKDAVMEAKVVALFAKAKAMLPAHYADNMAILEDKLSVTFNGRMRSSGGNARYRTTEINLNYRLLNGFDDRLENVFLHELAHLLAVMAHGLKAWNHGDLWGAVMKDLGREVERTHDYDTSALKAKTKKHSYKCACRVRELTTRKHNMILRGVKYTCNTCHSFLTAGVYMPSPSQITAALQEVNDMLQAA